MLEVLNPVACDEAEVDPPTRIVAVVFPWVPSVGWPNAAWLFDVVPIRLVVVVRL
jgi:hypothetical protein